MSLQFKLRVWWSRHLSYRLAWLVALSLGLSLCAWAVHTFSERLEGLAPRLYSPLRRPVRLALSERPSSQRTPPEVAEQLTSARYGVPVLQARPSLRLIGTLDAVHVSEGGLVAELGVYPSAFEVLTTGAQLHLHLEPPSLSLLLDDVQSAPRGRVALRRLREAVSHVKQELNQLLSTLLSDLKGSLPNDLLTRLSQDPLVLETVERHFSAQVIERLPWGALLDSTLASEEFAAIRDSALDGIKLRPILAEALKGATQHALKSKSARKSFKLTEPLKSTWRLGQDMKAAGARKAADRVIHELKKNMKRNQGRIKEEGGRLLARQAREAHLEVYVIKWVEHVAQDEALMSHLRERYQPELIRGAREGLRRFKERPEVAALLRDSWARLSHAGVAFIQALIFDHKPKNPGPNPLLIAVIEELIRGEQSPKIYLTPGPGERVQPGHLYEERRAPVGLSWLTRVLEPPALKGSP